MKRRIGLLATVAVLFAYGCSRTPNPSVLWHIVNDQCVPNQETNHNPAPCSLVDLSGGRAHGYVVLKDLVGIAQFLLMPTARIAGIESPEILQPGTPNYFALAWESRYFVEDRLKKKLPREDVTLAINSMFGRTQNQLHIHIDCIRPDVKAALGSHLADIGPDWAPFPVQLAGQSYRAMRVSGETLGDNDPFRLLAIRDPGAAADMGRHTLVVVGANFPGRVPGFIILDDKANLAAGDRASGEKLQDHTCTIASPA